MRGWILYKRIRQVAELLGELDNRPCFLSRHPHSSHSHVTVCNSATFVTTASMSDSDEGQAGVPLFEGFPGSASPEPLSSTKRKRDVLAKPEEKNTAKRRKLKKPKDVDDEALDVELGVNHAIAHMGSQLMADHVAQRTKRFQPELSLVEAEDYYIPGAHRL